MKYYHLNPTEAAVKILDVFIFTKRTQRKTIHILKTDEFELPDNKNTFLPGSD